MNCAYNLKKIAYTYPTGKNPAVQNLNLCIPEGATTALLGPNGAGKSTIMDLLLRWRKPEKGTITLFDVPLTSYNKQRLGRTVSLVPQEESSRFSFSVLEYVLFGRSPYLHQLASPSPKDVQIAYDALVRVGIESIVQRPVTALSGGEHQLVLLARALAQQPRILLLDEPTSSLDPGNTAKVITILRQLAKQGITLFFTTHDPSVAAECAHYVAMISGGELLFSGPTQKALTNTLLTSLYGTPMETFQHKNQLVITRGQ